MSLSRLICLIIFRRSTISIISINKSISVDWSSLINATLFFFKKLKPLKLKFLMKIDFKKIGLNKQYLLFRYYHVFAVYRNSLVFTQVLVSL